MYNKIDFLTNRIRNSRIDIDALNELIQYEENGKKFTISKDGEIICKEYDTPWYNKIYNLILSILKIFNWNDHEQDKQLCGIINIRNNCYLNAGLQILSRCYPLLIELLKSNYEKDKLMKLLIESLTTLLFSKDKYYNPSKFVEYFCKRNKEFKEGQQNCSQDFIRTILRNINETFEKNIPYEYYPDNQKEFNEFTKFIYENKISPETKAYSIFSGLLKIHLSGKCFNCGSIINEYSFSNFVDQTIYLDTINKKCKFSEVLMKNIGQENKAIMKCSKCKQRINLKSVSKFMKIPEIFIFTLERYLVRNTVPIEPDEFINLYDYVDKSYNNVDKNDCLYELFAINIRIGRDLSFGHEICQIKQKNNWYTIDDGNFYPRKKEFNEYSYGLFYRKIHKIK